MKRIISFCLMVFVLAFSITGTLSSAKTYKEGKTAWFKGTVKYVKNDQENASGDKIYVLKFAKNNTISAFGKKFKVKQIILSTFYEDDYAEYKNKKVKVKAKLMAGDSGFYLQPKIKTMEEV